jgi:uncharacterized repeat protein (TIGR03803 family)
LIREAARRKMSKFNWGMRVCGVLLLWAAAAVGLPAQTPARAPTVNFTTLHSFDGIDGANPTGALVQATDGNFYGTTNLGGGRGATFTCPFIPPNGCGTVFKITPSGVLTSLFRFDYTDGFAPLAGLVQDTNGKFYGTASAGGAHGYGTVFKITSNDTLTTLHNSGRRDGANPFAPLVQATNGTFYGTTNAGGANNNKGTVFKITPSGTLTTLYSFCPRPQNGCPDGSRPFLAGLIQATDGNLYGTTFNGGANDDYGTVFKITPSGTLTRLHSFDGTDGAWPQGGLVQDTDGNFYGTTTARGTNNDGTVFKITPRGKLTTLHNFDGTDGLGPEAVLVQGTDGNFYGTTFYGGAQGACSSQFGCGTLFKITPSGNLTTLYNFCSQSGCTDGAWPQGGLVQGTDGNFYGTTGGGANQSCSNSNFYVPGCGTVFSLSVGLGPFVETNPTSGKVGKAVKILGSNLTGATSVTFNGTAATFTVKSKSEITTTVPTGATTGTVQVVTPGGTLSSNVPFRVD